MTAERAKYTAKPVAVAASIRRCRRAKRRKRSIAGPYVQNNEDGRRPSTVGQLAELAAPLGVVLDEDDEDDEEGDDDDGSDLAGSVFAAGFFSAAEASPARLSVR